MPESNRVKSSHIYLLSFIQPTIVFTTMFVGGWTTCLGIIIPLAVYPLLDVFFSVEKENFPVFHPPFYLEWIPAIHVVFQLAILASLFVLIDNNDSFWHTKIAAISSGFCAGVSGIVPAHELGHYNRGPRRWLANLMMQVVAYPHFTQEHNRNHHRYVATSKDGASAPRNRGFWKHLALTIPLQWVSIYREMEQKSSGIRNPILWRTALSLVIVVALFLYDPFMSSAWLIYSASAVFLLEYVNYIRHYGLRRENGEPVSELHSWDSEARWSRWMLLELSRHSSHHLKANIPFWQLKSTTKSLKLPSGYFACFWPCMIPPLWRRLIHPKMDSLEQKSAETNEQALLLHK